MQNNLMTAHEKVKVSSACAVAMTKEQNAEATKFEKLRMSVRQLVGFSMKEPACLEAKTIKLTPKNVASAAKAEQLSHKIQSMPGIAKEARKLCERMSSVETAARAKDSKGCASPATRLKQKRTVVEVEEVQTLVKFDAWNADVAPRATELEK